MNTLILALVLTSLSGAAAASAAGPSAPEAGAAPLEASPLSMQQYVAALERIDSLLASNQLAAAQADARALMHVEVVWERGTLRADSALLTAITKADRAQGPHRARLLFAIAELRRATGMETGRADPKLLEQIAAEQKVPELPEGGDVPTKIDAELPLIERIAQAISDAYEWIVERIRRLIDWLIDLLPGRGDGAGVTQGMRWIVIGVVSLIVLVVILLAFDVLRRSRAATPEPAAESAPIGSKRDEDPLSRGANEWERYAGVLAGEGRYREAIRAWYHAVLVNCYAAGVLHFRKGRTNWEYIASLPPSLPWRADLIALTRRFEQEWYGADESSREAHDDCRDLARRIVAALGHELRGAA